MPRPRAASPTFTLVKRGDSPIFYVAWWEGDRPQRVSTRTAIESEARTFLNDFIAGRSTPAPPKEPSIRQIYEAYTEAKKDKVREHKNLQYAGKALLPILGDLSPASLTEERVDHYIKIRRQQRTETQVAQRQAREERYARVAAAGHKPRAIKLVAEKPLSNGTINRDLALLRAALNWAVNSNWLPKAPVITMPPAPPSRERWLTRDEYAWLLKNAVAPHIRMFMVMALHTGARKSAILELKWREVDLDNRRIDFGLGYGNKYRSRYVAVNAVLHAELVATSKLATSDYVIEHNGNRVLDIKTGFQAACRRAQLVGVSPHTLRHTAASWMAMKKVPYAQIAAFLGNSAAVVESTYAHFAHDYLHEAADALL
jgi:integrase